jgi:hypothetical protein
MRRKQRHGGLSPHYVRLIRSYLRTLNEPNVPQATMTAALFTWIDIVLLMTIKCCLIYRRFPACPADSLSCRIKAGSVTGANLSQAALVCSLISASRPLANELVGLAWHQFRSHRSIPAQSLVTVGFPVLAAEILEEVRNPSAHST